MCKIGQILTFLIFLVMAVGHGVRYFMDYSLIIHGWSVPVFWSLPIAIFFTFMALWVVCGFKCACKCCKKDKNV